MTRRPSTLANQNGTVRGIGCGDCSAVWVVVQRDVIDGDTYTMHPAYTTKEACLKRMKRLQDREEDSYSYGYRRIPVVGLPNK